jgi:hypothetical protein
VVVEISRLEDAGWFCSMQGGPLARLYACRSSLRAHNLSDIEIRVQKTSICRSEREKRDAKIQAWKRERRGWKPAVT